MYKVEAWLDRTAYRSRHSTEQIEVALVKAREENWNHGLAWSGSGLTNSRKTQCY